MQEELAGDAVSTLESIRRRGQGYLGYLLWAFMILGVLWDVWRQLNFPTDDNYFSLSERG